MAKILDEYGKPINSGDAARGDLIDLFLKGRRPGIEARYDSALTTSDNINHWAMADALDADRSNSVAVRRTLIWRSRYEIANNAYAKGMVLTHANYIVGTGPTLRMNTSSSGFNAMVEAAWNRWTAAVGLARKLRTMCMAKTGDGESIGVCGTNPKNGDKVSLDVKLIECEQCTTPYLPPMQANYIDGIEFDEWSNPIQYDILRYHPGGFWSGFNPITKPDKYPADFVVHWFRCDRPGQHRGIPELTPALNLFGQSRRYRAAVISAAELIASFTLFLKTMASPEEGPDLVRPLATMPIDKGMMAALPAGYDAFQPRPEHPSAQYGEFMKTTHNEEGRSINMPRNIATADSSDYNFSSGQLDHLTYFVSVDVERADGDSMVLEKIFRLWFMEAVRVYGWSVADSPLPPHFWDWPPRPQIDSEKTANARRTSLACGAVSLEDIWIEEGFDPQQKLQSMAQFFGVSEDEMRHALFQSLFANKVTGETPDKPKEPDPKATAA